MSADQNNQPSSIRPVFAVEPLDPNYPETSGTTLPLLSAVLAGFAVTSIVQLMLSPAADDLSPTSILAITAFLLAVICFLNAIVFSIKAQASNYLPFIDLGPPAMTLLNISDLSDWVRTLEKRWLTFFMVALYSFYSGTALFLAALDLIVWVFVGAEVGAIFLVAVILMVGSVVAIDTWVSRRTW